MRKWLLLGLLAMVMYHWGGATIIHAKAWLAPHLISSAWADTLDDQQPHKPWPWADTWPVARLKVPALDIDQFVLAGANGASLPFGPGHLTGTAAPGHDGTIVISAHRDTHFSFLKQLSNGELISLQGASGAIRYYEVAMQAVVDSRDEGLTIRGGINQLILVTCEPTNVFQYRGPYRLVVTAVEFQPEVDWRDPASSRSPVYAARML